MADDIPGVGVLDRLRHQRGRHVDDLVGFDGAVQRRHIRGLRAAPTQFRHRVLLGHSKEPQRGSQDEWEGYETARRALHAMPNATWATAPLLVWFCRNVI